MTKKKKPKAEEPEIESPAAPTKKKTTKKKKTPVEVAAELEATIPKKPKWTGSGWGGKKKGQKLDFSQLHANVVLLCEDTQFRARNVVKIIDPPDGFVIFNDRKYGIFVDPKDYKRLRFQGDQMFCIWDHEVSLGRRIFYTPTDTSDAESDD